MNFHHLLCQCVVTQKILISLLPRSPSFYHDVLSDFCSINIWGLSERTKRFPKRWVCNKKKSLWISPETPSSSQVSISPKSVFNFFWELQILYLFGLCLFSSLILFCYCFIITGKIIIIIIISIFTANFL